MDLADCLAILNGHNGHPACEHRHPNGAGSQQLSSGQIIDLASPTPVSPTGTVVSAPSVDKESTLSKIREELKGLSRIELVEVFRKTQEERVGAYKEYDSGLEAILKPPTNLHEYSKLCVTATARFATLSTLINLLEEELRGRRKTSSSTLPDLVRKIQDCEREKLTLVAASHLEKMRSVQAPQDELLLQGVKDLSHKIDVVIERINDALEEMRYALLEEEELNQN